MAKKIIILGFLIIPVLISAQNTDEHKKAIEKILISEGYFGYDLYYPDHSGNPTLGASVNPEETDKIKLLNCYYSLNHKYFNMDLVTADISYKLILGYDQFRDVYVLSAFDNGPALVDVYQGNIDGKGNLIADNLKSGTHYVDDKGTKHHNRLSLQNITSNSFTFLIEDSINEGKTWSIQAKYFFKNVNKNCERQ